MHWRPEATSLVYRSTMVRRIPVVLLVALVWQAAACGGGSSSSTPTTVRVTYRFEGAAEGPKVSYTTATGVEQKTIVNPSAAPSNTNEDIAVDVPSGKQVTSTIEAQHFTEEVECIIIDSKGNTIADNKAQGANSTATCEATAG
jgi:hypothetical protein